MPQTAKYEAPRLRIVSNRLAIGDELLRWLCEARKVAYTYEAVPLLAEGQGSPPPHPPWARLSVLPRLITPAGEARGIVAALELLDGLWRADESVFGVGPERDENRHLLQALLTGVATPALGLWLSHA